MITIARGALIWLLLAGAPVSGSAEPFVPSNDDAVLVRLPAARDPGVRALAARRARLAEEPTNLDLALWLASAYVALAPRRGSTRGATGQSPTPAGCGTKPFASQ